MWCRGEWLGSIPCTVPESVKWGIVEGGDGGGGRGVVWCGSSVMVVWCREEWLGSIPGAVP